MLSDLNLAELRWCLSLHCEISVGENHSWALGEELGRASWRWEMSELNSEYWSLGLPSQGVTSQVAKDSRNTALD